MQRLCCRWSASCRVPRMLHHSGCLCYAPSGTWGFDESWWGLMASVVGIRFGILAKPIYFKNLQHVLGVVSSEKTTEHTTLHVPIHPTSFCPLSHLALGTCSTKVYAQGDHGATGGREEFGRKRPQGACGGVLGQVFGRGFGELGAHRTEGWQDGKMIH